MICARQLSKHFGDVVAVKSVTFEAKSSAITGLVGPNGAGKSTTLRMLYGMLSPSSGSATIGGIDIAKDPIAARKIIGVLPHNAGVYPRLTARENILYFAELAGLDKNEAAVQIEHLTSELELSKIIDRRCSGFSHGELTKVALARALVHQPGYLLLDEPTTGLDVMAIQALRKSLVNLKRSGTCIVFSSHVMQEVAAICDHIAIIAGGELVAAGSHEQLIDQYESNTLEQAFLSAVNSSAHVDKP